LPRDARGGDPANPNSFICVDDGEPVDNQPPARRYLDDGDNYPIVPIHDHRREDHNRH